MYRLCIPYRRHRFLLLSRPSVVGRLASKMLANSAMAGGRFVFCVYVHATINVSVPDSNALLPPFSVIFIFCRSISRRSATTGQLYNNSFLSSSLVFLLFSMFHRLSFFFFSLLMDPFSFPFTSITLFVFARRVFFVSLFKTNAECDPLSKVYPVRSLFTYNVNKLETITRNVLWRSYSTTNSCIVFAS